MPLSPVRRSFRWLTGQQWHQVSYVEWRLESTPADAPVCVCVHGLTRNALDFDDIARYLVTEGQYRVFCIDVPGRGESEWLLDSALYSYPTYVACVAAWLAHLGYKEVDYVGTSMGGLIGMMLASARSSPLRRLVINDIGPFIPKSGVERLSTYVGKEPKWDSFDESMLYIKQHFAGFGELSDEQWHRLASATVKQDNSGKFGVKYDPAIADALKPEQTPQDVDLFPAIWDRISVPVMLLRGASSDLLSLETVGRMRQRGPSLAAYAEFDRVGHAPALMTMDQIQPVLAFLRSSSPSAQ